MVSTDLDVSAPGSPSRVSQRQRQPVLPPWSILLFAIAWAAVVVVPLVLTLLYSFLRQGLIGVEWHFTTDAWQGITQYDRDQTIIRTLRIALITTAIEFVIAFPTAYWLAKRVRSRLVSIGVLVLLTVPFFLSEDSRTVVWQAVYSRTGLVNTVLQDVGVIHQPISSLLFSEFSLYLGLIPIYFATMLFPIWLSITLIDDEYIEANRDLGGSFIDLMKDLVIPLAAPGIIAGFIFTLVPMLGDTVVPSLLGGGNIVLISGTVQNLVTTFQYPLTAAISLCVTGVVVILLLLLLRVGALRGGFVAVRR
jgi:ABC-type spermidine/putrescine transport system permease subunit I